MSACATELQAVSDTLFHWSVYEPECKCVVHSVAVKVASGLVIVDPVALTDDAWAELTADAPLRAVLLTNGNHVRHAEAVRKKYDVPIVSAIGAHKAIVPVVPDVTLLENELLYGAAAIPVPGGAPGETAFLFAEGILVLGDAVVDFGEGGLQLLPDKYCDDPQENRRSLTKLLDLQFHTLCFAHGLPVTQRAKEKLRALVAA